LPTRTQTAASFGVALDAARASFRSADDTSSVVALLLLLPPSTAFRMSCRPTELEEPTPNSTNDAEKTMARAANTHLPFFFRRSVKSSSSLGAAAFRARVLRFTFFLGVPTV